MTHIIPQLDPALPTRLASLRHAAAGAPIVIKVGGSIQDDRAQMRLVASQVAALRALSGLPIIVVHGGGKSVSAALTKAGLETRFVLGQRYTDDATLAIAERVLAGPVNQELVEDLAAGNLAGVPVVGLNTLGCPALYARKTAATDPATGAPVDLGLVGVVWQVAPFLADLARSALPVLAPTAIDLDHPPTSSTPDGPHTPGGRLNVNADLAASAVAKAVGSRVFILVSDIAGVRQNPKDPATTLATLSSAKVQELRDLGAIDGGMRPKIDAAMDVLSASRSARVCIIDGRVPGAITHAALAAPGEPITGSWLIP